MPRDDIARHASTAEPRQKESLTARRRNRRVLEVLGIFVLVATATWGLDALGDVVPFIGRNLLTLVALVFLGVPMLVLRFLGLRDTDYGLGFHEGWTAIRWGLALTLVTLIGFVPVYHFYNTEVRGFSFEANPGLLSGPSDRLLGRPADPGSGDVHIYSQGEWLTVEWTPPGPDWTLGLEPRDGLELRPANSNGLERAGHAPRRVIVQALPVGTGTATIEAAYEGQTLARSAYKLGSAEKPVSRWTVDGAEIPVSFWWILSMLIVQFVLVALPEEFFYRGYLQQRLSDGLGHRKILRLGPLYLTWPIVIVSALFGVGHVIIGWNVSRFLVFFPSLLFGYLRDRTEGIGASIVFHAMCNMMIQIASCFYLVG